MLLHIFQELTAIGYEAHVNGKDTRDHIQQSMNNPHLQQYILIELIFVSIKFTALFQQTQNRHREIQKSLLDRKNWLHPKTL